MNPKFEIVFGSDVIHDGVYLELSEVGAQSRTPLVDIFRGDSDGTLRATFYTDEGYELPFSVLEEFVQRARTELASSPPNSDGSAAGTA
jgi:hypothetical protein